MYIYKHELANTASIYIYIYIYTISSIYYIINIKSVFPTNFGSDRCKGIYFHLKREKTKVVTEFYFLMRFSDAASLFCFVYDHYML